MEALTIRPVHTAVRGAATGFSPGDFIPWTMSSPFEITIEEAQEAQRAEGYDPLGYGFFRFTCREDNLGLHVATWSCYASAD